MKYIGGGSEVQGSEVQRFIVLILGLSQIIFVFNWFD
jgi:hypothetical protein